jgi:AmmeMemoRadiSam system protein B
MFYSDDPAELRESVEQFLAAASIDHSHAPPKALIVPHAGYMYSGRVAASGYASIAARRKDINRVVLLGPSHRVYLRGVAAPTAHAFTTPLGEIPIDRALCDELVESAQVALADAPHAQEHSLEVQLPFLQVLLGEFELVPLVAGEASPAQTAAVLRNAWGDEHTVVLISSDLSHYHPYDVAQHIDNETSELILRRSATLIGEQACGAVCINGLLHLAKEQGFGLREVERMNSGATAGDKRRVVGYGAFALDERPQP